MIYTSRSRRREEENFKAKKWVFQIVVSAMVEGKAMSEGHTSGLLFDLSLFHGAAPFYLFSRF
jgi:hypothetical protein